jgi:hypothetical protein
MVAQNPVITGNYCYKDGGATQIGYFQGVANAIITDNHFLMADNWVALRFRNVDDSQINQFARNLIWGTVNNWVPEKAVNIDNFPDNQYSITRPTGYDAFVRRNKYDRDRAHIVVLNFDLRSSVPVSLAGILKKGQSYELRDAQNYFDRPILSGKYNGSSISIPMTSTKVVKPIGSLDPGFVRPHTSAEFGVFVLRSLNGPFILP